MPKVGYQNSSGWMTWVGTRDTFMSNNAVSMLILMSLTKNLWQQLEFHIVSLISIVTFLCSSSVHVVQQLLTLFYWVVAQIVSCQVYEIGQSTCVQVNRFRSKTSLWMQQGPGEIESSKMERAVWKRKHATDLELTANFSESPFANCQFAWVTSPQSFANFLWLTPATTFAKYPSLSVGTSLIIQCSTHESLTVNFMSPLSEKLDFWKGKKTLPFPVVLVGCFVFCVWIIFNHKINEQIRNTPFASKKNDLKLWQSRCQGHCTILL